MKRLSLVLAVLMSLPLHAYVLELRDQQTMATPNLTLNDLVQSSQGVTADDLNAVVGVSPSLGKSETWTRQQIEAAPPATLREQPIEWAGATECVVTRPSVDF